jgi:transposase-like protein
VEERLRFAARLLDGEAMTELCREFGISRKTGYKIFDRYKEHGLEALSDRSRRPVRYANQLPGQVESLIVSNKPHGGARKFRELLLRRLPGDIRLPAKSTIHAVLDRHGFVKRMGKRLARATGTPLSKAHNDLWCADFKGSSSSVTADTATPSPSPTKGILAVNVIGSCAMGLIAGWFALQGQAPQELRLFLTTASSAASQRSRHSRLMLRCL